MKKKVTHWSYSAYGLWKQCALRFKHLRLLGWKEPMSWPVRQGIELHLKAEHYLKGNVTVLPPQLRSFSQRYRTLRSLGPIVEQFWGVSQEWRPTKKNGWVVMKMDSCVPPSKKYDNLLLLQDLKTGNWYPEHEDQADLYATIGLALYPKASGAEMEFWYSKTGLVETHVFKNGKAQKRRIEKWTERGKKMLDPKQKYLATPTPGGCKFCSLRSDKGGPCEAWKSLKSGGRYAD